jgi:hypothetical protein
MYSEGSGAGRGACSLRVNSFPPGPHLEASKLWEDMAWWLRGEGKPAVVPGVVPAVMLPRSTENALAGAAVVPVLAPAVGPVVHVPRGSHLVIFGDNDTAAAPAGHSVVPFTAPAGLPVVPPPLRAGVEKGLRSALLPLELAEPLEECEELEVALAHVVKADAWAAVALVAWLWRLILLARPPAAATTNTAGGAAAAVVLRLVVVRGDRREHGRHDRCCP